MKQITLATVGFEKYGKTTRRAEFLARMDEVIPWGKLVALIEPHYPKAGKGRHPVGIERMLRIHFLQQWYNLSDPSVEEALYESASMRAFARIDLGREPVPDETTVCKFRHLLEAHDLGRQLFAAVNAHLIEAGFKVSTGSIVDATIVSAPSSTKNERKERDPEMHQTKKGNQWYFGMKTHIGVDSRSKLIHSVVVTPANVHDSQVLPELLHGNERRVYGDSAYVGQREAMRRAAPGAKDFTQRRAYRNRALNGTQTGGNRRKSRVRARVEHAFRIVKVQFGFTKVRYRGLHKNGVRVQVLCALANLFMVRNAPALSPQRA